MEGGGSAIKSGSRVIDLPVPTGTTNNHFNATFSSPPQFGNGKTATLHSTTNPIKMPSINSSSPKNNGRKVNFGVVSKTNKKTRAAQNSVLQSQDDGDDKSGFLVSQIVKRNRIDEDEDDDHLKQPQMTVQ